MSGKDAIRKDYSRSKSLSQVQYESKLEYPGEILSLRRLNYLACISCVQIWYLNLGGLNYLT